MRPAISSIATAVGLLLSACASPPGQPPTWQPTRTIAFTTREFTEPTVDVTRDGSRVYFNVLGEIFTAPTDGGTATLVHLGPGWKERPMLSPDDLNIAFLSDRGGELSIWRQSLAEADTATGEVSPGRDATTAAWVAADIVVSSGVATTLNRPYSLAAEATHADLPSTEEQGQAQRTASMSADDAGNLFLMRRGAGILIIARPSGFETTVVEPREGLSQPRVSNDGTVLGYVVAENGRAMLFVMDLASREAIPTGCVMESLSSDGAGAGPEASFDFLPGNQSVILARDGKIFRCDFGGETRQIPISVNVTVETEQPIRAAHPSMSSSTSQQPRYLAAAPDLSQLAFMSQGHLWVIEPGSQRSERLTDQWREEYTPAYSPAGDRMAYASVGGDGRSHIVVRDLSTGSEEVLLSSSNLLLNPAWSPDGSKIAIVEALRGGSYQTAHTLRWVTLDGTGGFFGTVEPGAFRYFPVLTWHADGNGIFYTQLGGFKIDLISHRLEAGPAPLLQADVRVWDIRVSPSGRFIAFHDKTGISVAPFAGSVAERPNFSLTDIEGMRRVTNDGVDYFQWLADDRLVWSAQSNVRVFSFAGGAAALATLDVPRDLVVPIGRRAYVGARIITMSEQGVVEDGILITNDNRIEFIGTRESVGSLEGVPVTDLVGKTIIPGLIDAHFHNLRTFEVEATQAVTRPMLEAVAYGVTTVFDPSSPTIDAGVVAELSQDDDFSGPSYYSSGLPILGPCCGFNQTELESRAEAVTVVGFLARSGALMVKDYLQPTRFQRRWLADAARQYGLGITAHEALNLRVPLSLVVDGYTGIEHPFVWRTVHDDVKEFLIRSDIALTPTLGVFLGAEGLLDAISDPLSQRYRCLGSRQIPLAMPGDIEAREAALVTTPFFAVARDYADILNRGGNVSIGGHGYAPGLDAHGEMWLLALAGAEPENILRAATVNGARKLGMQDRIGSLATGMDADFVVLNSDPLIDIRNAFDISRVVRRGRTVAWPVSGEPPGWASEASWDNCRAWNLGLPAN